MRSRRWIGVDYGSRRIGIAMSDPLGLIAQPVSVRESKGLERDAVDLAAEAAELEAAGFVVGLPLRTDGSEGPEARRVREFAVRLEEVSGLPVHLADERFTTQEAARRLREQGLDERRRRGRTDHVAAALILQAHLDRLADRRLGAEVEGEDP